ncbi:hypothetical protein [Hymenobacter sp. BT730]|uniref:hypothetical protein n=1 Tax=Hymenobacter sp. BT730 TaxID=3063332 RepID=UPI0026DF8176|nr:hypothetical protein [Hymenobacter sp. BT730]
MTAAYKVLICQRATGHVMNADAQTVFLQVAGKEAVLPYRHFESLAEAEQFAWQLYQQDSSLEMALYFGNDYLHMIPPIEVSNC